MATNYTYDANGSLTSTNRWNYAYDAENRLVQAHDTVTNKAVRFKYDGKGRRIAKEVDDNLSGSFVANKTYQYLYEGDEPIQDFVVVSSSYVVQHRYVHGASVDERLVHWAYDQNTGAEISEQYYHRDHQGSIVAMSGTSGARAAGELYTYDAYGNMAAGNTDGQPFRYTGRRWDDETGLYYYRARYYSAKLGRFLQTDPIGYEDNMNMYGYVGNDPVNKTDPSGNSQVPTPPLPFDIQVRVQSGTNFDKDAIGGNLSLLARAGMMTIARINIAIASAGTMYVGGPYAAAFLRSPAGIGMVTSGGTQALNGGNAKEVATAAGFGALFGHLTKLAPTLGEKLATAFAGGYLSALAVDATDGTSDKSVGDLMVDGAKATVDEVVGIPITAVIDLGAASQESSSTKAVGTHRVTGRIESNNLEECGETRCGNN